MVKARVRILLIISLLALASEPLAAHLGEVASKGAAASPRDSCYVPTVDARYQGGHLGAPHTPRGAAGAAFRPRRNLGAWTSPVGARPGWHAAPSALVVDQNLY